LEVIIIIIIIVVVVVVVVDLITLLRICLLGNLHLSQTASRIRLREGKDIHFIL